MLGKYEKRFFDRGEKVWLGRYRSLVNVLHWHMECEIIRVVEGSVRLRIGSTCFEGSAGDCFFCPGQTLHYIISAPNAQVDVVILHESITKEIIRCYTLASPKLPEGMDAAQCFADIRQLLQSKGPFYREAAENRAAGLVIDIFRSCPHTKQHDSTDSHRQLISQINEQFAYITFEDAVRSSGYTPSHFSKLFRRLSGVTFSRYLNTLKVEHAIDLMRADPRLPMARVCLQCGFSTVRNFNRVFKEITGFSPRALPAGFVMDTGVPVSGSSTFDPTDKTSVLL